MERGEFVELLILDGCFVVMYMLGSVFEEFRDIDTSFLWKFKDAIFRDMLLLENQLPFFLLQSLYDLCASNNQSSLGKLSFIQLAHQFFIRNANEGPARTSYPEWNLRIHEDKALNHFVHFLSCYMKLNHLDSSELLMYGSSSTPVLPPSVSPPTATELYDSGISFRKESYFAPVVFNEHAGILGVPQIIINEIFEIMMRNIIAYEHCQRNGKEVSSFVMFMHFLLNTDKDVSLLINEGIIHNHLGSTKEVTKLFHDLCKNVVVETNVYNSEYERMREYCRRRHHRWMTSLKRDYFGTPWALVSFIAAVLLLSLTLLQAVVAVVALYK